MRDESEVYIFVGFMKPNGDYRTMLLSETEHKFDVQKGYCKKGEYRFYLIPGCTEIEELGRVMFEDVDGGNFHRLESVYYSE